MKVEFTHAGLVRLAASLIALVMSFYHMYVIVVGPPEAVFFRGIHLVMAMSLIFLWFRGDRVFDAIVLVAFAALTTFLARQFWPPASLGSVDGFAWIVGVAALVIALLSIVFRRASESGEKAAPTIFDYLALALGAAAVFYQFVEYDYIINRIAYIDDAKPIDFVLGFTLLILVLEATRRVIGWALPVTALVFLAYAALVAKVSPQQLVDQMYLTTEGIFGIPLSVSASYVVIFVLFGSFMERTGTGQLFMDFAMSLTGHTAGGPGKVSVVSSSLFGTISGSAVANVMVDGPIAIPLMKRTGFKPHFAAGVEAVASTGGQIMPPLMGAAAFVMAEFLQVGYAQVVIWALIPAILYYVACFCAVHFEAKRAGILGVPRAELPVMRVVLRERGHLFIPILAILAVMYSGYSAPMAAFWGTMLCFPAAWFGPVVLFILPLVMIMPKIVSGFPELVPTATGFVVAEAVIVAALIGLWTRSTWGRIVLLPINFRDIIEAMIDGAKNALAVALACACAGIIIGIVTLTGLGLTFTQAVVGLSQNTLLLALILTGMAGIVLGMGMPTTPAYIIMTSLLVPAVVKLGVPVPAAHMFAFYFAILSAITPPVALAVFAAAGLAKADLWRSGLAAVKIGCAGFIVPFMFVYEPALLMLDPSVKKSVALVTANWLIVIWSMATAVLGIAMLAGGLHGYFVGKTNLPQRILLIVACFCLVNPHALDWALPDNTAFARLIGDGFGLGVGLLVIMWQLATRRQDEAASVRQTA